MRILVTGGGGQLGTAFEELFRKTHEVILKTRDDLDVTDTSGTIETIRSLAPDWILHCAAFTGVDQCERDPDTAFAINVAGTQNVAVGALLAGSGVIYVSTDYVFDGTKTEPYVEGDQVNPISVYGKSKQAGEEMVRSFLKRYFIVRTSWLYGNRGKNFFRTILGKAVKGEKLQIVDDQIGCPTSVKALARQLELLAREGLYGLYHASCGGYCSWYGFAEEILRLSGLDPGAVLERISSADLAAPAERPAFSALECNALKAQKIYTMPSWRDALIEIIEETRSPRGV